MREDTKALAKQYGVTIPFQKDMEAAEKALRPKENLFYAGYGNAAIQDRAASNESTKACVILLTDQRLLIQSVEAGSTAAEFECGLHEIRSATAGTKRAVYNLTVDTDRALIKFGCGKKPKETAQAFIRTAAMFAAPPNKTDAASPALYGFDEMAAVEAYIKAVFGETGTVFHETIQFPDIHLDVHVIEPAPERGFYTLVTTGMGAHRMNVPPQFRGQHLERAELLIRLPADWEVNNLEDERWAWPFRLLKYAARLPCVEDTWLAPGHTLDNGGRPYAENTRMNGALIYQYMNHPCPGPLIAPCRLPDGEVVNFYQLNPLYEEETQYVIENGSENFVPFLWANVPAGIIDPARINLVENPQAVIALLNYTKA